MKALLSLIVYIALTAPAFSQSFEWVRTGGGIGQDAGQKLAKDKDGNIYVTGYFAGSATFEGVAYQGRGRFDILISKYLPDGTLSWLRYAGGADNDAGTGIGVDDAGNIYVTGYFSDNAIFGSTATGHMETLQSQGSTDIFIAKYEPSGKLSWAKRAGSFGEERATDLVLDKAGNLLISGYFSNSVSFGGKVVNSKGSNDAFTAKYDNAGNCLWAESLGGFGLDKSLGMDIDTFGNTFITGFFYYTVSFSGSSVTLAGNGLSADMFVAKYTPNGSVLWAKSMGGPYGDASYAICVDQTGNFFITGYFLEFAYFDSITITGRAYDDIFIAKYDTLAECEWAIAEGGYHLDLGTGIDTDEDGNIYLTGLFDSLAWFGNKEYRSVAYYDVFISKYSKKGILIWIKTGGGNDGDFGMDVLAGDNKTLYATGLYKNEASFGSINTSLSEEQDVFITKLSDNYVGIREEQVADSSPFIVYPNPTSGIIFVSFNSRADDVSIELFNIEGKLLLSPSIKSELRQLSINLESEMNGIYFLKITVEGKSFTEKLLKYGKY